MYNAGLISSGGVFDSGKFETAADVIDWAKGRNGVYVLNCEKIGAERPGVIIKIKDRVTDTRFFVNEFEELTEKEAVNYITGKNAAGRTYYLEAYNKDADTYDELLAGTFRDVMEAVQGMLCLMKSDALRNPEREPYDWLEIWATDMDCNEHDCRIRIGKEDKE